MQHKYYFHLCVVSNMLIFLKQMLKTHNFNLCVIKHAYISKTNATKTLLSSICSVKHSPTDAVDTQAATPEHRFCNSFSSSSLAKQKQRDIRYFLYFFKCYTE